MWEERKCESEEGERREGEGGGGRGREGDLEGGREGSNHGQLIVGRGSHTIVHTLGRGVGGQ